LTVPVGNGHLERATRPAKELVGVEGSPESKLVGIAQQVAVAALRVVRQLGSESELKVDTVLVQTCAQRTPIAE
jgi:hypothetical protein